MKTNVAAARATQHMTFEGTPAKRLSDVQALRRAVASCLLWEGQFYEDGEAIADRIKRLTLSVTPTDAASIAFHARNTLNLRHVPLWIARWLASGNEMQKAMVPSLLPGIIQRPDEITEFLSLYWKNGKTPIASCVKRGLAAAFTKFNAYQLAKYNRDEAIKLRDVLFLVHAHPRDAAQAETWKQLIAGTLPVPDTWEVQLSSGADKKATWERLLDENILGGLALLRNLRNMQEADVSMDQIRHALRTMNTDRILPFRFIAAARHAPPLESDLESAMFATLAKVEKLSGRTALIVDTSPSMWHANVSAKSEMTRFDAAAALAMLCREICESVDIYAFNDKAYDVPDRRGFALRDALESTQGGWSCGGLAVERANRRGYDRIIVLTDGEWQQSPTSPFGGPAHQLSPAPISDKAYLINVASYQNAIGSNRWVMLDGWSESLIDYIRAVEAPVVG